MYYVPNCVCKVLKSIMGTRREEPKYNYPVFI